MDKRMAAAFPFAYLFLLVASQPVQQRQIGSKDGCQQLQERGYEDHQNQPAHKADLRIVKDEGMPEVLEVGAGIEKHDNGPSPDDTHHHEGEGRGKERISQDFPEDVLYVCCGNGCPLGDVPSNEESE